MDVEGLPVLYRTVFGIMFSNVGGGITINSVVCLCVMVGIAACQGRESGSKISHPHSVTRKGVEIVMPWQTKKKPVMRSVSH